LSISFYKIFSVFRDFVIYDISFPFLLKGFVKIKQYDVSKL